jgi:hypothetical protein
MAASFNEKLVVNNGQVVSPQPLKGSSVQAPPSINQLIYKINNERDFDDYILKHSTKAPLAKSELNYVKHPTQASAQSHPTPPPAAGGGRRTSLPMQSQPPPSFTLPQPEAHPPAAFNPEPASQASYPSYPQPPQQQIPQAQAQVQAPQHSNPPYSPVSQNPYPQPDYPRGPAGQATAQQSSGVLYNSSQPPINPVFGLTLEDLFRRDGSPVPMVVYQCIQAVDLFGLEVEGIYRIPGTSSHIQQMKALFDSGTYSGAYRIE